MKDRLVLGTRGSALALAQTDIVLAELRKAHPELPVTVRKFTTSGDRKTDLVPLGSTANLKGQFTKELEDALLRREIDLAVHSCKDMPCDMPGGLVLAAILERADTADVFLTSRALGFAALPPGAHVATSSVRRARQLLFRRPDLVIDPIRGNVQTRLRKLRESSVLEGTVLAKAGLDRLGLRIESGQLATDEGVFFAEILDMLPAISQGAIAIQTRSEDAELFVPLIHRPTWLAVRAERELMRLLNGDCTMPVGVGTSQTGRAMTMRAILFEDPGEPRQAAVEGDAEAPEALAAAVFAVLRPDGPERQAP